MNFRQTYETILILIVVGTARQLFFFFFEILLHLVNILLSSICFNFLFPQPCPFTINEVSSNVGIVCVSFEFSVSYSLTLDLKLFCLKGGILNIGG